MVIRSIPSLNRREGVGDSYRKGSPAEQKTAGAVGSSSVGWNTAEGYDLVGEGLVQSPELEAGELLIAAEV